MLDRLLHGKPERPGHRGTHSARPVSDDKFPVLHYGSIPRTDLATWDFKVWGGSTAHSR